MDATTCHPAPATRRLSRAGLGLGALAALTLTACTPEEDAEFTDGEATSADGETADDSDNAQTDETPPEDQADETEGDDETSDSEDEEDSTDAEEETSDSVQTSEGPIDPADAMETVEYSLPADDLDGTMTLGLHHLEVQRNTVELLLTFTAEHDSQDSYNLWNLHGDDGSQASPTLIDRENLVQYSPLSAGPGQDWETDVQGQNVHSGEPLVYWATFAVPEDDVDTVNVGIPAAPEFEDVQIDRGEGEAGDDDEDEVDDEPGEADDTDGTDGTDTDEAGE